MRALLFGAVLIATALMAADRWLLPRDARADEVPGPDPLPRWARLCLFAIVAGGVAVRAAAAWRYPPYYLELWAVDRARAFSFHSGLTDFAIVVHAPASEFLLHEWARLGERLGIVMDFPMIRAPHVLLAPIPILLVARMGALVGAPLAGLAAAALFAFTPATVLAGIHCDNYFFETTGALWFAERCLAYLLFRRRVYRSLALSMATALWCGYMNLLVLAVGVPLLLAAAGRRREQREALYTAALGGLLLAPLLPLALKGGTTYLDVSITTPVSAAVAESLSARYAHPVLEVQNSFSAGSPWQSILWLTSALTGRALFAAGVLLLVVRQRLRALPLLALIALYPLASARIYFLPHNYNSVFPFIQLACCWGWSGIPISSLRHRPRLAALAVPAVLAATVAGGLAAARAPRALFQDWYWDPRPLIERTARNPTRPVLLDLSYDLAPVQYYLCPKTLPVHERVNCAINRDSNSENGAWALAERYGRELATRLAAVNDPAVVIGSLDQLLARPAWRAEGWLRFTGSGNHEPPGGPSRAAAEALDRHLQGSCALAGETAGRRLYDCYPAAR